MANTILLGGGTGLIGSALARRLADRGDEVRLLSRHPDQERDFAAFAWDAEAGTFDSRALVGVTHVVNLAGAGIADGRWTDERKRLIVESRTQTTALLASAIQSREFAPQAFVSASAIGYYGDRADEVLTEESSCGTGFLSGSTVLWERAIGELAGETGVRTCALRTGIVLAREGGALPEMARPARFGLSGYFGDGAQWYSWIHLDDIVSVYVAAIDDARFVGPVNAVAPEPVRNREFAQVLAKAIDNPALAVPVPAFGLRLAFGEMSHTVLDSTRVSAAKLVKELGFAFAYPELEPALRDLLG